MPVWNTIREWFLGLGTQYHVNPYLFGAIYVGAIPFFFLCLRWTIKNKRHHKPIVLPLLLTGLCFISAYLYLLIAGKNIPLWVYLFIALMIGYGVFSIVKKIRQASPGKKP